jgi:CBS domain-containing protein
MVTGFAFQGVYMPVLEVQRSVTAHADLVWGVVADLNGDSVLPPAAKRVELLGGTGLGLRRRIIGEDGYAWIEECTEWKAGQRYTMVVDTAAFPVKCAALRYTCVVVPEKGAVLIRFYIDYLPRFGALGSLLDRFSNRRRLFIYARQQIDNWVNIIHAREWAYRVTVASLLDDKGRKLYSMSPAATVAEAAAILREHRIGSVMVLAPDRSIAGVVSERDIVHGMADQGAAVMDEPVSGIMTNEVIVAHPTDNMMTVMSCMSDRRIRHLPVVDEGMPVGIISIGDVIKARISELEGQSETLRDYIEARHWHELYQELGPAAYTDDLPDNVPGEVQEQV